ncbi:16900_t:CDS:2, partial [Gigaspora rosea]
SSRERPVFVEKSFARDNFYDSYDFFILKKTPTKESGISKGWAFELASELDIEILELGGAEPNQLFSF